MKGLDWPQIASVYADREASSELLDLAAGGDLKAKDVHVSSFVFSPLLRGWRHCLHTNCRQLLCGTNMTPSVVTSRWYRQLICVVRKASQAHNDFIFKYVNKATSFDLQSYHQAILNHISVGILTFKRRIKSRLPFADIIRSSPYSQRFQDKV